MASLDPGFLLTETDFSSPILSLNFCGTSTLVATSHDRILILDVGFRRITHTFWSPGEPFNGAFLSNEEIFCLAGQELWRWSLNAADLKSDVSKMSLPFKPIHLKPFPNKSELLAIITDNNFVATISHNGCLASNVTEGSITSILDSSFAQLKSDHGHITFELHKYETAETKRFLVAEDFPTLDKLFLRWDGFSIASGNKLKSYACVADGDSVAEQIGEIHLIQGIRILLIHPKKDFLFAISFETLQMISLKFGTILASQLLTPCLDVSKPICVCDIHSAICLSDGIKILAFPYSFASESTQLIANFGLASTSKLGDAPTTWPQLQSKKCDLRQSKVADYLNRINQAIGQDCDELKGFEQEHFLESEKSILLEAILARMEVCPTFCPVNVLIQLKKIGITKQWDKIADLLSSRNAYDVLIDMLTNSDIGGSSLCYLLRIATKIPDVEQRSLDTKKYKLVMAIMDISFREDDVVATLKTFPGDIALSILELLVNFLKINNLPCSRQESFLAWVTAVVDSHFVDLVTTANSHSFEILMELERFMHDLEIYFELTETVNNLLSNMRGKLIDSMSHSKTKLDPNDDYGIQVMTF